MKDDRMWWAKFDYVNNKYRFMAEFQRGDIMKHGERYYANNTCMSEQLWAIKKGLAD